MSNFWSYQLETTINIPNVEEIQNVTCYQIEVTVKDVKWRVSHRYNDFYELHGQLVVDHGVSKDILPPKKVIRNKCPVFIETRRQGLEKYLQNVLSYLKRTMPVIFVEFLHFHYYDTFFLLQNLAFQICTETEQTSLRFYNFKPIELHAISECLKQPFPEVERHDKRYDLCHVFELCSQLEELIINGCSDLYLNSNIVPNLLEFDFSAFKALFTVKITAMGMDNIYSVDNLRQTVQYFHVNKAGTTSISQVLLCDVVHKADIDETKVWPRIKTLDLSYNNLTNIDDIIKLVPNIDTLILNQNKISSISDLSFLTRLTHLSLSNNLLTICDPLNTKLGNVRTLNLAQNNIACLSGFSKLYSLENLDLSCNKIVDVDEIMNIGELPCLENLILTGNSVATMVDYRIKVLEQFGDRAKDICLDNEKASQAEIDKVQVLRALRIVKEGKTPVFGTPRNL